MRRRFSGGLFFARSTPRESERVREERWARAFAETDAPEKYFLASVLFLRILVLLRQERNRQRESWRYLQDGLKSERSERSRDESSTHSLSPNFTASPLFLSAFGSSCLPCVVFGKLVAAPFAPARSEKSAICILASSCSVSKCF